MSYDIIGKGTPVWLRAVMVREGDDVVTRCCVVAEGQFFPIEVRVNVPGLIAQARALGIDQVTGDTVGGFGSWLKKAVKKVTKSKIVKAVGKVAKKVANSPIAWVANPSLVVASHTTHRAATGKGLVKGKLGAAIDLGTKAVQVAVPAAAGPSALKFVAPKAAAAIGIGLRAVQAAKMGPAISAAAKVAQQKVNLGKAAANAIAKKTIDPKKAMPLVKQAAALQAGVKKLAPTLAKKAVQSNNVQKAFINIASKAAAGNVDARAAASVLARSAKALSTIQKLEASAAGGLPGLLITASGHIVRAPKGRFLQSSAKTAQSGTLYRGRGTPTLRGLFSAVSGEGQGWDLVGRRAITEDVGASPSWGGDLDPADDIDGPMYSPVAPDDRVLVDDYALSDVSGVRRKAPRPYRPGVTRLERELQNCAESYDELAAAFAELAGREPDRYDDPRAIDTTFTVGALTP